MPKQLIIRYQEQQHHLKRGEALTLGRSNKNDIVISQPTVSRNHLCFSWGSLYPQVSDLDSTCGLIVDGRRTKKAFLKTTHQIYVGQVKLTANLAQFTLEIEPASAAIIEALSDSDEVTLFGDSGPSDIEGEIKSNKHFRKLLVNLEMTRRTGTLHLTASNGEQALIVYGLGKIRSAKLRKYKDLLALDRICSLSRGTFRFTTIINVEESNLYTSAMCYLRNLDQRQTRTTPKLDDLINSLEQEDADEN